MRVLARTSTARFAAELKTRRGARSLRSVARAAGISAGYLCDLERAQRCPAPETIARLAEALGARDRIPAWTEFCGRVPEDIEAALRARPERWDAVRAALDLPVPVPTTAAKPAAKRPARTS